MRIKFLFTLIIFFPVYLIPVIHAQRSAVYQKRLYRAKNLINKNQGQKSVIILKQLLNEKPTFDTCVLVAQAYALNNEPHQALRYYELARWLAGHDRTKWRVAMFGLGKMYLWLENYPKAESIFSSLLSTRLNKEDHEIALAGMVQSLSYQDKPMKAYYLIHRNYRYSRPRMVLAAGQAALWSQWPEKSKNILKKYQAIIRKVPLSSWIARDLEEVDYETHALTANNIITPGYHFEDDSDGLFIQNYFLRYSRRIMPNFRMGIELNRTMIKHHSRQINANGFSINHYWRQNDYLDYVLSFGSEGYKSWYPALWFLSIRYKPNDVFSIGVLNREEVVQTIEAINNETSLNTTAINFNINPVYRLRFSAAVFHKYFSDHNNRNGYFVSGRYLILHRLGLGLEVRARGFQSSKTDTIGYFNPKDFNEEMFLINFGRRLTTHWRAYLHASLYGRQFVNPGENSSVHIYEGGVRGFFSKNILFNAYAGYSNSNFSSQSGYSRYYGGISLSCLLD